LALWQNLETFVKTCATYAHPSNPQILLDIGESDIHKSPRHFFPKNVMVETLDIVAKSKPTYVGDICKTNENIPTGRFDFVCCYEVLEHTYAPWLAPAEIWRMLKPDGYAFISVPFNLEIHAPEPDYWRFTHYGLCELFKSFKIIEVKNLKVAGTHPIQYTMIAQKKC
jgi:SAM-dependent methyltransferase